MCNKLLLTLGTLALTWGAIGGSVAAGSVVADAVEEAAPFNGEVDSSARFFIYLQSASWCGSCRALMPKVVEEYNRLKKAGVEVVLVSSDFSQEAAEEYLVEYNAKFPAVEREHSTELPGFRPGALIPWMCIADADGNILQSGSGHALFPQWRSIISGGGGGGACNNAGSGSSSATRFSSAAGGGNSGRAAGSCSGGSCGTGASKSASYSCSRDSGSSGGSSRGNSGASSAEGGESVSNVLSNLSTFNADPELRAKYYVYLHSASWCGFCRQEMPKIVEAYKEMKDAGVELLLIGADSTPEESQKFLETYGATFPGTHKDTQGVEDLPGYEKAHGYPSAIFVTEEGEVLESGHGSIIQDWRDIINGSGRER